MLELVQAIHELRLPAVGSDRALLVWTQDVPKIPDCVSEAIQYLSVGLGNRYAYVAASRAVAEAAFAIEEPRRPSKFFSRIDEGAV